MRSMTIRFILLILTGVALCSASRAEVHARLDVDKEQAGTVADIRVGLDRLNEVLATKDLAKVMSVYDNADDIVVIGSDSGEVYIGRERVQAFMKVLVSMPFAFSFPMDHALINHDQNIAWVFVDSEMVHTRANGKASRIPYRITAILVQRGGEWKWKMFSGSIPRGE